VAGTALAVSVVRGFVWAGRDVPAIDQECQFELETDEHKEDVPGAQDA